MAQRVNIVLTDDLDESEAAETVTFGLDGNSYEIDLSADNAARLRDALRPFVTAGRKTGGRAKVAVAKRRAGGGSGNATDVRAWARGQGMTVSDRGRVSAEVRSAYDAAH